MRFQDEVLRIPHHNRLAVRTRVSGERRGIFPDLFVRIRAQAGHRRLQRLGFFAGRERGTDEDVGVQESGRKLGIVRIRPHKQDGSALHLQQRGGRIIQ